MACCALTSAVDRARRSTGRLTRPAVDRTVDRPATDRAVDGRRSGVSLPYRSWPISPHSVRWHRPRTWETERGGSSGPVEPELLGAAEGDVREDPEVLIVGEAQ